MHGHHSHGVGWGAGRSDGDGGPDSGRFCGRNRVIYACIQNRGRRMRFSGVMHAAWGGGCTHMLSQTVFYTVVCVVLRDRHVEKTPFHPLPLSKIPPEVER